MLSEQTHDKLINMKLWGMASSFQDYLDERKPNKLPFEERFGILVDREFSNRSDRRLKRRLSTAKLREEACLEDVDFRHPRELDRSVMQRLATCQWIAGHENVIITGPTGLGKTWLACALANQACRNGHTAVYARVPRLLQKLGIARADGSYTKELARLAKADVLVLDDWGIAPMDNIECRDLLEILEDRHGRKSTIVTSQVPVKKWHEYIEEPTVADAILDRLIHNAYRIPLKGPSIRKIRAEKMKLGAK